MQSANLKCRRSATLITATAFADKNFHHLPLDIFSSSEWLQKQRLCIDKDRASTLIQPQGIRKYKMRLAARVTKLELLSSWRHMWSLSAKSVIVIPFECIAKWSGKLSQLLSGSKISPESNQNLVQSPQTHLWLHWQCPNHQISTSSHNQFSSLRRENTK